MTKHDGKLEAAFQLIEHGNEFESNGDWWSAADSFGQAVSILKHLSHELSDTVVGEDTESTNAKIEEQIKISQLYGRQSGEYRIRARCCFIKALTSENDSDRKRKETIEENDAMQGASAVESEPICMTISEEEAQRRVRIFSSLYAKEIHESIMKKQSKVEEDQKEDVTEKQDLLEERLKELNSTLPSGFKTSKERMADINRGLSRLGLSLYSQEETPSIEIPASEEEQVQQIMAQAKDEAAFELKHEQNQPHGLTTSDRIEVDMQESSTDESSDDEQDFESDSEEGIMRRKKTKAARRVVRAQVKLAELMALLDFGSKNKPEDSDDDGSKSQNSLDLEDGKKLLVEAKACLEKALREWTAPRSSGE